MKNGDWIIYVFIVIIIAGVVLVGVSSLSLILHLQNNRDVDLWNEGICGLCGGRYEFMQAVGHYYETWYIYDCEDCGEIIEISKYHKEAVKEK